MKFYLVVTKGNKKGLPIHIHADLFLIGSDKMCQLRAPTLGPKHCALTTREKNVFLRDMDSGQSTLVNGSAIPPNVEWPLHAGDLIAFGNLEFMIQYREKELSQRDLEEWAAKSLDVEAGRQREEEEPGHKPDSAASAAASIMDKLSVMRGQVMGRLRVGVENGITTVRFNDSKLVEEGEVALVRKEMGDQLNRPNMRVLLDLKNVRRLSTAGVSMLRDFYRWLRPFGSTMALCRIHRDLHDAVTMLKMENIPVFDDKKKALTTKW